MESVQTKPVFKRVVHSLNESLLTPGEPRVILLGVKSSGMLTEDYQARGDELQRDVTSKLSSWWEDLKNIKDTYHYFRTLNKEIDIYAPLSLSGSEYLLEWIVFSGVADPHTDLAELNPIKSFDFDPDFVALRNALNGKNWFNQQNLVIDFKYGVIVARRGSKFSSHVHHDLAYDPLSDLFKTYDLYITNGECRNPAREKKHFDTDKARTLAFTYLQKTFFT